MESATLESFLRQSAEARAAVNVLWALLAGVLALLVQAGFAFLGTGLVRAKNAAHSMAMGILTYGVAILGFWSLGFGLQGGAGAGGPDSVAAHGLSITLGGHVLGLVGWRGFFLNPGMVASATCVLFVLRAVSAVIVAAIPAGAMAERARLRSVAALAFVASAIIYPIYGSWVWGDGWLAALGRAFGLGHGVVDYAGASVIHLSGGAIALVAAKMLGPRLGKYSLRGQVRPIPAHNSPMVVLGTLVLAAGWFGLLCGATLSYPEERVAVTAVNAMLAAAAGGMWASIHTRLRFGKPDLSMMCNGLLAGLVGISAAGPFVSGRSAVVIGGIASLLAVEGALFIERRLHIDDPTGAAAVHGLGGAWGLLAVGIFANGHGGTGLNGVAGPVCGLVAGEGGQLLASGVGLAANLLWVVPVTTAALWLIGRLLGNRVSADDEIAGLDVPELGMTGYVNEAVHATAIRSSDLDHTRVSGGS